jgi:hypothetical protein
MHFTISGVKTVQAIGSSQASALLPQSFAQTEIPSTVDLATSGLVVPLQLAIRSTMDDLEMKLKGKNLAILDPLL